MSRAEREAWLAQLRGDPALQAAWDGFTAQLETSMAALKKPGPWDDLDIKEAVGAILASRAAADAVYVAAGLDPAQADDAPDEE